MKTTKRRKILKKVRLKTLFLLAITLASNSFAWFIYTTKVSSNISAKVREWNVTFEANGQVVEKTIEINIDSLYPGMDAYNQTLTAANSGESKAQITYEIVSTNILGDNLVNYNYSNEDILNYLKNNYPFTIEISSTNSIIEPNGEEKINITVSWPYESGDDEKDTYWGNLAYNYHQANPGEPSIVLVIKISAIQLN
ncbi:MAG: hypothetical protein SOZ11_04890 [Bacilli bacterium]|nr:hypothetical protein [Bacilli bacterium]